MATSYLREGGKMPAAVPSVLGSLPLPQEADSPSVLPAGLKWAGKGKIISVSQSSSG